jgi:signal transduction histidine kinase
MNKRLLFIYTTVFVLTGLMLHMYRSSYKDMKVFIGDVNTVSRVVIRLERLDALLHFWMNNDKNRETLLDLYIPANVAYDSILSTADHIKRIALYQEQRLRMDTLKRQVRLYQRLDERSDTTLTPAERDRFRKELGALVKRSYVSATTQLENRKTRLEESTSGLDQWLLWMLILAGSLILLATFYSFNFLQQRQKAEGFSKTIVQTTNNGIVSFVPVQKDHVIADYKVTFSNEAGVKLLNLKQWPASTLRSIVPEPIFGDVKKVFDDVYIKGHRKTIEGYLDHNRNRNWLQASIAPLQEGILVSVFDLSQVKKYEQRLTYKIKQLEVANEELQQYAYVTSHDLQEPLRKMQMFSDMGLRVFNGNPGENKDHFFRKITDTASHMRELIQTLLVFTRSTDKPDALRKVDMNTLIRGIIQELEIESGKAKVVVDKLSPVQGSEIHLQLLFTNLLSNCVKYSRPEVPLKIEIRERKVTQQEYVSYPALDQFVRYTCITVRDNGVGFEPAMNEKIFTIFQRLYNKNNVTGAGIGLAICRKIVHQHHGYIYASGKPGEGATFYIFLPLDRPSHND